MRPSRGRRSTTATSATTTAAAIATDQRRRARSTVELYEMQVAILSDIHGNRHAFEAVLADAEAAGADEMWCLGDLVGYGAEPDACVELARRHAAICLAGNHDLGVTGEIGLDEFSTGAALAARWTQETICPANLEFLRALSPSGEEAGVGLYHASPRDPVWEYVLSALLAELCFDVQRQRVALIGHSHVALSFVRPEGDVATGEPRRDGDELDIGTRRVAAEPRLGRPAARRRPARRLAHARPRPLARDAGGASSTTSRAPPRRSAPRACPIRSPSALGTVSDRAAAPPLPPRARCSASAPRCSSPAAAARRAASRPRARAT